MLYQTEVTQTFAIGKPIAGEPAIQVRGVLPFEPRLPVSADGRIRTCISRSQGEVTQIFTTGKFFPLMFLLTLQLLAPHLSLSVPCYPLLEPVESFIAGEQLTRVKASPGGSWQREEIFRR